MSQQIWKFQLAITGIQTIQMPKGAKILSVQNQIECVCIWAIVDTSTDLEERKFEIYGTGHKMTDLSKTNSKRTFIGTVQLDGGQLVLHVFELS